MPHAYLCTAPGRAGIIGNPTDMYGGSVISCSTLERSAVLIEPADGLSFEVAGLRHRVEKPDDLRLDGGYPDVAKAVIDFSTSPTPGFPPGGRAACLSPPASPVRRP